MDNNSNHCIKRIGIICLIILCLCTFCGSVLAAIDNGIENDGGGAHTNHSYTTRVGMFYTKTQHYERYKCICGATIDKNYQYHIYSDSSGKCIYCGRPDDNVAKCGENGIINGHTYSTEYVKNDNSTHYALGSCATCGTSWKSVLVKHEYKNGKCKYCGTAQPHTCNYTTFQSRGKDSTEHWDVYKCSCGNTTKKNVKNHSFTNVYTSTGTTGHNKQTKCTICNYISKTVGEKHTFENGKCKCGEPAKCGENGIINGHTYSTKFVKNDNSTHYALGGCATCGTSWKSVLVKHEYKNGKCKYCGTAQPHTCNYTTFKSSGKDNTEHWDVYACSCGKTTKKNIKDHNFTNIYTSTGTTGHNKQTKCTICNYISKTVGEKHNYKLTSTKNATCKTSGEKIYSCTECNVKKTEIIKVLGHDYDFNGVKCTDKVLCKRCKEQYNGKDYGHEFVYTKVDAVNHRVTCKWCENYNVLVKHTTNVDCDYCDYKKETEVKKCDKNNVLSNHRAGLKKELSIIDGKYHTEKVTCENCNVSWESKGTHIYSGEKCECGERYRCGSNGMKTGHSSKLKIEYEKVDSKTHKVYGTCPECKTTWNANASHYYTNGKCVCNATEPAKEQENKKCSSSYTVSGHIIKTETTLWNHIVSNGKLNFNQHKVKQNSYCEKCNVKFNEVEKVIKHTLKGTDIKKINEENHSITLRCINGCKDAKTVQVPHEFKEGVCTYCGYQTKQNEEKPAVQCKHDGNKKTEIVYKDEEYHTNRTICAKCNAVTKESNQKHNSTQIELINISNTEHNKVMQCKTCNKKYTIKEAHKFDKNGKCQCGANSLIEKEEEQPKEIKLEKMEFKGNTDTSSKAGAILTIELGDIVELKDYLKLTPKNAKVNLKYSIVSGEAGVVSLEIYSGKLEAKGAINTTKTPTVKIRAQDTISGLSADITVKILKNTDIYESDIDKEVQKFEDVSDDAWYKEDVDNAVQDGLFNGTSENTFSPDVPITRGMFVTVLARLDKADVEDFANVFDDVKEDAYYKESISWAVANGIVNGVGNGNFAPDAQITREAMAVIIYNYIKVSHPGLLEEGVDTIGFEDEKDISSWAKEAVMELKSIGLINGKTDGKYMPKDVVTRAEGAVILQRLANKLKTENSIELEGKCICEANYVPWKVEYEILTSDTHKVKYECSGCKRKWEDNPVAHSFKDGECECGWTCLHQGSKETVVLDYYEEGPLQQTICENCKKVLEQKVLKNEENKEESKEEINYVPSNYSPSDFGQSKPTMDKHSYTDAEWDRMEKELKARVEKAGFGTRAGVVEAALYLASLEYAMPYRGTPMDRGAYIGAYPKIGLNRTWGSYVKTTKEVTYNGKVYEKGYNAINGMDCGAFVSWALVNGGVKPEGYSTGPGASEYTNDKEVYISSNMISALGWNHYKGVHKLKDVAAQVEPGDIALTYGYRGEGRAWTHVGLVVGVDDNNVYIAESTTGSLNKLVVTTVSKTYTGDTLGYIVLADEKLYTAKNSDGTENKGNMPKVW